MLTDSSSFHFWILFTWLWNILVQIRVFLKKRYCRIWQWTSIRENCIAGICVNSVYWICKWRNNPKGNGRFYWLVECKLSLFTQQRLNLNLLSCRIMIFVVNLENAGNGNVLNSSVLLSNPFQFFLCSFSTAHLSYCYKKVLLNVGCLSRIVLWDNATFLTWSAMHSC